MDATHPNRQRRETDQNTAVRLTGLSMQQLIMQLIGGVLLAAVVGLVSSWATQQVMAQQLAGMTRQIQDLSRELRQMRQDLYAPRYRSPAARIETLVPRLLPPGRP